MDREGFRNRLKQYKKAREENPGLKYWEWKDIPKYDEGTDNVGEWNPRITAEGYDDKGYYAQAMNPLPEVTVVGSKTRSRSERPIQLTYVKGLPGTATWTTDYNPGAGALEIVSPEFELLSGGIGLPRQLYNNRIASLAKELISNESEKTLSKVSSKIKSHIPNTSFIGETFNVPLSKTQLLVEMYKRNISKETQDVLNLLGKERTLSNFKLRLSPSERDFLRKHNIDESILTDSDIRKLKELRQQSISEALEKGQRVVTSPIKAEGGSLVLQKNTKNGLSVIGQVNYGSNPYDYMRYLGRELKPINNMDLTDDMVIGWIQGSLGEKGVSKDLYNGLAHWLNLTSPGSGFISGMKLMSPEPTTKTLDKLNKILISNLGEYLWATGITTDNPIYKIINPTGEYPAVKSLMFDPKIIKNGKIITDLDNPDIYFAEGGEVTGPPTYEDWYKDITKPTLNAFDDVNLKVSMEEASADLHNMAMMLPGYAERWAEYQKSKPKEDPSIDQFVDNLWENENPNNIGYRNGKYYPHKSPEGGAMTIGPGFKLGSGSHRITEKQAKQGVTKYRLNKEAEYIGEQHLKAVNLFLNYGLNTNPADTVSPLIKMGLMDLRHLVGPLNTWHELRDAVLSGDLGKIKKESTVTWSNNGKTKVDKRRKKIRDEKYFYYE